MKKNWILKLSLLVMVLTLVTMPMVSSTYAKYVTTVNASDTARVAKWGVDLGANVTEIFGASYNSANGTKEAWTTATPTATTISVNASSNEAVIAPGTEGSFTFNLKGTSEVALNLEVTSVITPVVSGTYEPINFTLHNGTNYWNGTAWVAGPVNIKAAALKAGLDSLATLAATPLVGTSAGTAGVGATALRIQPNFDLKTLAGTGTGAYIVTWEWPFESSEDTLDTTLGVAGTAVLTIALTITATQID